MAKVGRKRTELGPDVDARIAALARAGGTSKSIVADLAASGVVVSTTMMSNRLLELLGPRRASSAERAAAIGGSGQRLSSRPTEAPPEDADHEGGDDLPAAPEDVPEDASLARLDRWIRQADEAIASAKAAGNLPLLGQMLRVASTLAETRRKATPPAPLDPNESPDMVKLGAAVAERLHKMIDVVAGR